MPPQSRGPASPPTFTVGPEPSTPDSESAPPDPSIHTSPSATSSTMEADRESSFDSSHSASSCSSTSTSSTASSSPNQPPRRILHHSSSSLLTIANASAFAPPFYNRPPTPLPPSPSLTSLLRPSFSTTTSRPSTPDTSDGGGEDTESAVVRKAMSVPRKSPKVPTYEYYGFGVYVGGSVVFLVYLLWSYLPSPFLEQLGISYYPNRWWALAIPSFLVMTIVYIYIALASYNTGYLTLPMNSLGNFVDEAACVAVLDPRTGLMKGRGRDGGRVQKGEKRRRGDGEGLGEGKVDWRAAWNVGTDAVMDVPVGGVCEILYGDG